jgi:hypothetical protein
MKYCERDSRLFLYFSQSVQETKETDKGNKDNESSKMQADLEKQISEKDKIIDQKVDDAFRLKKELSELKIEHEKIK